MERQTVIVFGSTGAIGGAICRSLADRDCRVLAVRRKATDTAGTGEATPGIEPVVWDVMAAGARGVPPELPRLDAAVWAQGANCNDDIFDFDLQRHNELYGANVSFILVSLQALLHADRLASPSRLCIISSIWQNIARQKKLSYCTTKAALHGLVQSLAIDLGSVGHLVNAVLPGALDTPMTRANLSEAQIGALEDMTPLGALPTLADVCGLVAFLCLQDNTGITGQFIAADKGFSHAKLL
ncbi:MAG: SDR family NAD(P)-dependent oxidoreductase [Acidobacteriaceae bacterium]